MDKGLNPAKPAMPGRVMASDTLEAFRFLRCPPIAADNGPDPDPAPAPAAGALTALSVPAPAASPLAAGAEDAAEDAVGVRRAAEDGVPDPPVFASFLCLAYHKLRIISSLRPVPRSCRVRAG